MTSRFARCFIGVWAVLSASGCALVRHHMTQQLVADHVYEKRVDDLWPEAKKLVSELGYSYTESSDPRGVRVLATDWKPVFDTSEIAASWTKVVVQAVPFGPQHCKVYFLSSHKTKAGVAVAWRQSGGVATLAEYQGLPAAMRPNLMQSTSFLKQAAQGDRWAGRDVALEAKFLARVDPETARDIRLDVDAFLADFAKNRTVLKASGSGD